MKWFSITGALLLGGMLVTTQCFADSDQDVAREAVRAGEILPLNQVLQMVQRDFPGKLLEVGLERKGHLWVYDLKLLQNDGEVRKMRFNAKTAALIGAKTLPAGKNRQNCRRAGREEEHEAATGRRRADIASDVGPVAAGEWLCHR